MREARPARLVFQDTRASQTASGTLGETTPDPRWWTSGTSCEFVSRPADRHSNYAAELQGQALVALTAVAEAQRWSYLAIMDNMDVL